VAACARGRHSCGAAAAAAAGSVRAHPSTALWRCCPARTTHARTRARARAHTPRNRLPEEDRGQGAHICHHACARHHDAGRQAGGAHTRAQVS
jgi:hypothetical protein